MTSLPISTATQNALDDITEGSSQYLVYVAENGSDTT